MRHVLRNTALALLAGVSISLISTAFLTSQALQGALLGPDWSYYGLPFPVYQVKVIDIVGSFHYFSALNLVGDILVWFAVSFIVFTAFNARRFITHLKRNAALAATGGALFSVISMALFPGLNTPYLHYYGLPFPIYGVSVAHGPVGSIQYFFTLNAAEDFLVWFGTAIVVISTLDGILARKRVEQSATAEGSLGYATDSLRLQQVRVGVR